jgi:hypothetical protein
VKSPLELESLKKKEKMGRKKEKPSDYQGDIVERLRARQSFFSEIGNSISLMISEGFC